MALDFRGAVGGSSQVKGCMLPLADGAASCPKADVWAKTAAPFILQLGAKDNGKSVSVGGGEE